MKEIYIVCQKKTVGTDWMTAPKKYTLRHAAGAEKYTTKTNKIWVKIKEYGKMIIM